jgi:uncharacterized protein YidB (DUF937 family)
MTPSLLSNYMARSNPQLAGLLGRGSQPAQGQTPPQMPPAPPQMPPSQGPGLGQRIMGGIGTLMTGRQDPNLSEEENAQIRREALIQAGLATIAASTSQTGVPTLGQALATGAVAGREAAVMGQGTARERMAEREQMEQAQIRRGIWQGNMMDQNARLAGVTTFLEAGMFDDAEQMMKLNSAIAPLAGAEQARLIAQRTFDEGGDPNDPGTLMSISIKLREAGLTEQADSWQNAAASTAKLIAAGDVERVISVDTDGDGVNDTIRGVDPRGNTVYEFKQGMDPYQAAALVEQRIGRAQAAAMGLNGQLLSELDKVGDDWRVAKADAATLASQTRAVMSLDLSDPTQTTIDPIQAQTLIIGLNKLLDPSSVVREGEFDRVYRAVGVVEEMKRLMNYYSGSGEMPIALARSIQAEVGRLSSLWQEEFETNVLPDFIKRAALGGVDQYMDFNSPFAPLPSQQQQQQPPRPSAVGSLITNRQGPQ